MNQTVDRCNAVVRPPIAWALAIAAGLAIDWIFPLPFAPNALPHGWIGAAVFGVAFVFAVWAIMTIRRAGTPVETVKPTTTIVAEGPFRFTRNPIYIGMIVGQIGLAIAFDSLWILATLLPFYLIIRHGVVAREEAYLERKFGETYLSYKSRVRRWV